MRTEKAYNANPKMHQKKSVSGRILFSDEAEVARMRLGTFPG